MAIQLTYTQHLPKTLVMGVINTTPDSFSDGGVHYQREVAVSSALQMLKDGVDIIDVGAESTRPGSSYLEIREEKDRAIPVIADIIATAPNAIVSIDTRRREIAEAAIKSGASIINDISGFRHDPSMIDFAVETGACLVVMHMLGEPKTMQKTIEYRMIPGDIIDFFKERLKTLESTGIHPDKIVIDPGIGFGKTFVHNLILINRLSEFLPLGKAVLMGPSRKAFIGRILDLPNAADRDTGTLGAVAACVMNGASIVRTHEVARTIQVCRVLDAVRRESVD